MKLLRVAALFLAVAALSNVATVAAFPWLVNAYVMHRIADHAGGVNRPLVAPRADATARTVVRPSPDLLYTACVFDVTERPLRITAPVQDSYVSVSMFAADTSNFFTINDVAIVANGQGRKQFDLVLARDPAQAIPDGARLVVAPSGRGLILFRSLIPDEAALERLVREFQSRQDCAPL